MRTCIYIITALSAFLTGFLIDSRDWLAAALAALILVIAIVAGKIFGDERRERRRFELHEVTHLNWPTGG